MNDLWKIFDKLSNNQSHFCFQSHNRSKNFSLAITTPKGDVKYFHSERLENIEASVQIMWGHLLESKSKLPAPPGFPKPC